MPPAKQQAMAITLSQMHDVMLLFDFASNYVCLCTRVTYCQVLYLVYSACSLAESNQVPCQIND